MNGFEDRARRWIVGDERKKKTKRKDGESMEEKEKGTRYVDSIDPTTPQANGRGSVDSLFRRMYHRNTQRQLVRLRCDVRRRTLLSPPSCLLCLHASTVPPLVCPRSHARSSQIFTAGGDTFSDLVGASSRIIYAQVTLESNYLTLFRSDCFLSADRRQVTKRLWNDYYVSQRIDIYSLILIIIVLGSGTYFAYAIFPQYRRIN